MDHHQDCLAKLCRVCGSLTSNQRVTYDCASGDNPARLLAYMKVDISNDDSFIHPKHFCHKCYSALKRAEQDSNITVEIVEWEKHMTNQCDTCDRYTKKSKGGRPPKPKRGRQKSSRVTAGVTAGQLIHHLSSMTGLPKFACGKPLSCDRFCEPPPPIKLEDFLCKACGRIADQPVESVCGNLCCKRCLCEKLQASSSTPTCPCCSMQITKITDLRKAPDVVTNILPRLVLCCDNSSCACTVPLEDLRSHTEQCSPALASQVLLAVSPLSSQHVASSPPSPTTPSVDSQMSSPHQRSLQSILESPLDRTPTKEERSAATHLVKRILNKQEKSGETGSVLKLSTGGQVCTSYT